MRLILEEKLNKRVKNEFAYNFDILEKGLYSIEVTGRAKSWLQNTLKLISFFKDDDLAVKIDSREFPKLIVPLPILNRSLASRDKSLRLNAKGNVGTGTRLFDSEAAWNGNKLKDLSQINVFFIYLEQGKHSLSFVANQSPLLETVRIYQILNEQHVIFEPHKNYQIERGNRRPWLNFILVDLALEELKIQASAGQKQSDDDDLQLRINGERQINDTSKSHKYWYWCGRVLKGQSRTFDKRINLPAGLHYIELWADNAPRVSEIRLKLDLKQIAKIVWNYTILREKPDQNSKTLIDKINKNSRVIILEKAIKGERSVNEDNDEPYLSDRWHFVEYQNTRGYIFSMALEIEGEDNATIKNLITQKSKELNEDECLMFAVAKRESTFFPYMVSTEDAQGIFQLKGAAVIDVNKEFGKNFENRFDKNQNIEAGILYFQIIKKKYEGKDSFLERCLAGWNRGKGRVSADESFVIEDQPLATQQFISDVFKYWEDCKNELKNSGKILLVPLLLISVVVVSALNSLFLKKEYSIPSGYRDHIILAEEKIDVNGDGIKERLIAVNDAPDSTFGITEILLIKKNNSFLKLPNYGGEFQWVKVDDFNKNGKIDVAVLYGYSGSAGFGTLYLNEWSNSSFAVLLEREEIGAEAEFKDLDNDGVKEILFSFRPLKWSKELQDIYRWDKENLAYIKSQPLKPRPL